MSRPRTIPCAGRGALLLEVMLALAIFAMAGTAILSLVNNSVTGMQRARLAQQAADLARSAMARLEAGLETPQTLNGPVRAWRSEETGPDAEPRGGGVLEALPEESGWELEIDTEPSQFTGLTRITVRAIKHPTPDSAEVAASHTLRQLVRLSGKGEDRPGVEDELAAQARSAPSRERRPAGGGPPPPGGGR